LLSLAIDSEARTPDGPDNLLHLFPFPRGSFLVSAQDFPSETVSQLVEIRSLRPVSTLVICYNTWVNCRKDKGLTLIEIVFVFLLVAIVAGLGLSALGSGDKKASSAGLAVALADEFRSARQLAIRSGHPVAIGIPETGVGKVSHSIFQLEGWNRPTIKRSRSFEGDHPDFAFAPALWSGAIGTTGVGSGAPLISKFTNFDLVDWLPTDYDDDAVFCFTPDGGVMANSQPTLDGRYTIVVAHNLVASGGVASGGDEPRVVYIDQAGAVEIGPATLSAGSSPNMSTPKSAPTEPSPGVYISQILVTPDPGTSTTFDGICVPGQHITLELYAYELGGRQLFAKWTQTTQGGASNGTFSFPDSQASVSALRGELERMEYLDSPPPGVDWGSAPTPTGGVWRGRWTWTVPVDSQPGHSWELEADIKDVTGTVTILNGPPPTFTTAPAPQGRLLIQRINAVTGLSELVRMNPDSSGEHVLSTPNVEETLPSVDRSGTRVAYLSRVPPATTQSVRVRNLEGGQEEIIAGPGDFTSVSLSPNGRWVSYHNNATNQLITREVTTSGPVQFILPQSWTVAGNLKSRSGWSEDENYMLYGHDGDIWIVDLTAPDPGTTTRQLFGPVENLGTPPVPRENLFAPTVFRVPGPGPATHRVAFTIGSTDPVLAHIPFNPTGPHVGDSLDIPVVMTVVDFNGPGPTYGSGNQEDNYPSINSDGSQMILPRKDAFGPTRAAIVLPWNGTQANFYGPPTESLDDILYCIWIPEPQ
jgi:type II secretory pathway pseudopilin PulG